MSSELIQLERRLTQEIYGGANKLAVTGPEYLILLEEARNTDVLGSNVTNGDDGVRFRGVEVCVHPEPPTPIADQPPPKGSRGDIWWSVIADMTARRLLGITRYGTVLQAHNGRDALVDAYQEALDLCVYLRQAIEERETVRQRAGREPLT